MQNSLDLSDKLKNFQTGISIPVDEFTPAMQENLMRSQFGMKNPDPQADKPKVGDNQMVVDKDEFNRLKNYEKVVSVPGMIDKIGEFLLQETSSVVRNQYQQPVQRPQVPPVQQQVNTQQVVPQAQQPASSESPGTDEQKDPWMNLFGMEDNNANQPGGGNVATPQNVQQQPPIQSPIQQPVIQPQVQQPQQPQRDPVLEFNKAVSAEAIRQGLSPQDVINVLQSDFSATDIVNAVRNKLGVSQAQQQQRQPIAPLPSLAEEEKPYGTVPSGSTFSRAKDPNVIRI